MMASNCFFLLLGTVSCFSIIHGQPSTDGYTSIDCGVAANTSYSDSITGIPYTADDEFIAAGMRSAISSTYQTSAKQLSTLRSFPSGSRNCYVLPVKQAAKYLVRASFMYGNYDGLNQVSPNSPLLFDLYLDVNFWWTVNITGPAVVLRPEAIFVASADTVSVCLVKTGSGTPFISALELRPLRNTIYSYANATQNLALFFRLNLAPASNKIVRYPDDRYDRIWSPLTNFDGTTSIATHLTVKNFNKDEFEAPSVVMQTAVTPDNSSTLSFYWDFVGSGAPINEFYADLHFSELQPNTSRSFNVYLNDGNWYANYTPPYLLSGAIYSTGPLTPRPRYQWALNSSGLSTLPPILNALEVYTPSYLTDLPTDAKDVDAITAIKEQYQVMTSWAGDPCAPKGYAWDGLNCSYGSNPPRITDLNLSSSSLTGTISPFFAELSKVKSIDLSYNNLTGSIPNALGNLLQLRLLDLSGNNLSGSIPDSLLEKSQHGLVLRVGGNNILCAKGNSCELTKKKKISTAVIVGICLVSLVLVLAVIFILWRMRKSKEPSTLASQENSDFFRVAKGHLDKPLQLDNRQFTYKELEKITNKFERVLGKGGFGSVFHGYLDDGTQVAVKTRSESSSQGTKEFLAEVQHLVRIHHKNLVSMVGYCMEGDYMALVYEYMSQGTLQDHISGTSRSAYGLSWGKRLQIAIEAAEGLEYLHKGCKPPLIHRDVKTANILLNEKLEAKIADFGLSKAFQSDVHHTHVSTAVVGTPGYLDPEYYLSFQLSEKSDVYSFGVVLLELITAEPPIRVGQQYAHIVQRVHERIASGDVEDVVDPRLQSEYDVNSIWKIADLAFRCTAYASNQRPTMTDVVMELKESLALEKSQAKTLNFISNDDPYRKTNEMSLNSGIELEPFRNFAPSAR